MFVWTDNSIGKLVCCVLLSEYQSELSTVGGGHSMKTPTLTTSTRETWSLTRSWNDSTANTLPRSSRTWSEEQQSEHNSVTAVTNMWTQWCMHLCPCTGLYVVNCGNKYCSVVLVRRRWKFTIVYKSACVTCDSEVACCSVGAADAVLSSSSLSFFHREVLQWQCHRCSSLATLPSVGAVL